MLSEDTLNHRLVNSSAKNSLRSAKNEVFFLFWILVHRSNGAEGAIAFLFVYATEKYNDCCPIRQRSHLIALFEVFYNSEKIILPWFFEVFILQFVITVGITLVDSTMKTISNTR